MRDLTSRLRDIVRRDHGGASPTPRELTYVSDVNDVDDANGRPARLDRAAEALGGTPVDVGHGACIAIDRTWDADHWHGRRTVGGFVPASSAPLALFDARAGRTPAWAERVVFFDLETTGLSGGAGTLAFLAGCGWFEDGAFRVRQFFLAAPSGERAMLDALARVMDDASLLVTFNGRTFDVPLMETRWAFHRAAAPTGDLPHFDMLPSARRLWGRREAGDVPERASCSLGTLERSVLDFHRIGDVPGFEIPVRYFHFLRTGDARSIEGVLEHNRYDLLSLAGVMSHALMMATDGPESCRHASEQMGLGRLYERGGDSERALRAFELAAGSNDRDVRPHAFARLAAMHNRAGRHDQAATAWHAVLDAERRRRGPLSPLARRATEALAIYHEHRAGDLAAARTYAEQLHAHAAGRTQQDAAHRLGRIDRKLASKEPKTGLDF